MNKDAYYFPHDSNAKDDPKCLILIEELGLEGYGIFWVLIETLRDQKDFKAPIRIIPALARRYNTSTEKIKAVVNRYDLFIVQDNEFFFSESLIKRMQPLLEKKHQRKIGGIKGNLIKYGYAEKEDLDEMTDEEILRLNDEKSGLSHTDRLPTVERSHKSKEKESKEEESKVNYVQFVDYWNEVNDCNLRVTDKKRESIRARLRTYSEEEIKQSILNRSKDDWINGEGEKYKTDWMSFWRNDEKVERYLHKKEMYVMNGTKLRGL